MMKHNDFRIGGMVSVWIGNFPSDIELDDYMPRQRAGKNSRLQRLGLGTSSVGVRR